MTAMRPQSDYSVLRARAGFAMAPGFIARGSMALGMMLMAMHGAAAQDSQTCKLDTIGVARVAAVRDARSLLLADGREVRLAGVEVPRPGDAGADTAIGGLVKLALDREVTLKRGTAGEDRYGRLVAYVYAGDTLSLQEAMLAAGHARVSPSIGERACASMLLKQENTARRDKRGLWADDAVPRLATQADAIAATQGRFAVLEGTIVSVRESRGVVYMNFGRRIGRDFTVTILKRNERNFAAAGLVPKQLEGKRVRVRGWIEQRRGPVLEATRPEQIELAGLN